MIDWHSGASLIDSGQRFPVHGTLEQCVEAWRAAGTEGQGSAVLLSELAVSATATAKPAFSFRGKALEELSAILTQDQKTGIPKPPASVRPPASGLLGAGGWGSARPATIPSASGTPDDLVSLIAEI
jgi:hypothetical protein